MARTVLIAVLFILGCNQAMAAPQVLIVHSYHQGNEWVESITQGMETFLQEALPQGSRILHRPPFFFHLSRGQLLLALLIVSVGALALLANIVLRLRAERTLQNRQARLKAIHENVAAGIALADPQGRYLEVNDKWAEMFGSSTEAFIGKSFLDVTFNEDREENRQEISDLLAGRTDHYRLQKRFTREDGTVFWVDNSVTPILNRKSQVEALVGIIIDITEHKQAEEQLQAANLELDAFIRTASHDLRSPLTGIIGFAEFLGKEYRHQLDDQGVALLHHIEQSGHKMRQLLEDLLSFAWVGYVEIPQHPVDADLVAQEIVQIHTQKTDRVTINRSPLPAVHIPRSFLFQLFDNLIGNAVRYAGSASGPIQIGGELQCERILYFVRDHGPGVAPEERERIFAPFYRGAEGQKTSGTGIGLATVQKIARSYGGRAWLEETPGGGCTFWVEIQNLHPERQDAVSSPAALYL